jgi:hypothetical protein
VRVCARECASAQVGVAACVVCSVLVPGDMGIPQCRKYEWQFAASGCVGVPRLRLRSVDPTDSPFREGGGSYVVVSSSCCLLYLLLQRGSQGAVLAV